ncbi:ASB1 isoform 4 [Pongo abelii]|uniref:ASB1 isoform 4 n=1 Tax=Pongo abelii TaxID=9601 RepID=A0A2J8TPD0_PONAB|nr:ASB1 isoform 4 [Pongo abelii]
MAEGGSPDGRAGPGSAAASTRSLSGAVAGSPAHRCELRPLQAMGTVWTSSSGRGPRWIWWM